MGFGATFAIAVVFFLAALRPNAAFVMGNVQGANSPIVGSTVTLYAANAGVPMQLAQATTDEKDLRCKFAVDDQALRAMIALLGRFLPAQP